MVDFKIVSMTYYKNMVDYGLQMKHLLFLKRNLIFNCCVIKKKYERKIFSYINFKRPLPEVLEDQLWKKFKLDLEKNYGPKECFEKCSSAKWSLAHATEW